MTREKLIELFSLTNNAWCNIVRILDEYALAPKAYRSLAPVERMRLFAEIANTFAFEARSIIDNQIQQETDK